MSNSDTDNNKAELGSMVAAIYRRQPLLLFSVFRDPRTTVSVTLGKDSLLKDPIEVRLKLIENSIGYYSRHYSDIKRALKFKPITRSGIDSIDKLANVTPDTLGFIASNPQYLVPTRRKNGIHIRGKTYLPEKTLVNRQITSYDIYENRYILSFLELLRKECRFWKAIAEKLTSLMDTEKEKALHENKKTDFSAQADIFREYVTRLSQAEKNIPRLFGRYSNALGFSDVSEKLTKPRMTAVFKQIPEYNIFFEKVFMPWFRDGLLPSDEKAHEYVFRTAFSKPYTTYELFIVSMLTEQFRKLRFEPDDGYTRYAGVHEKESRYQDYAYVFPFTRSGSEKLTLFYSASVYVVDKRSGDHVLRNGAENADEILYRNTTNTFPGRDGKGCHYEPDLIIKYENSEKKKLRYIIADAKKKGFEEVRAKDMPELEYKYLNSIGLLRDRVGDLDAAVSGICAIYNADQNKEAEDYHENAGADVIRRPFVKMLYLNATDRPDDSAENIINKILPEIVNNITSKEL